MVKPFDEGPTAAPKPRAGDAVGTEQRILDAAHAVFLQRGTAGARMQEIAREAGVNPALLHYYFRSKARLAEAVFAQAAGAFMPAVLQILASDRPLEEKVQDVVQVEIDTLSKAPFLPAYLISEMTHNPERVRQLVSSVVGRPAEGVGQPILDRLRQQLEEGVRAGTMRPIDPDQFVVNLLSLCIFPFAARPLLMMTMGKNADAFDQFIARRREQLVPFFLGALRP